MTLSMHLASIDLKATGRKFSNSFTPTFLGMGRINDNFHKLGTLWEFNKNWNNFVKGSVNSFAQVFKTRPLRPSGPAALQDLICLRYKIHLYVWRRTVIDRLNKLLLTIKELDRRAASKAHSHHYNINTLKLSTPNLMLIKMNTVYLVDLIQKVHHTFSGLCLFQRCLKGLGKDCTVLRTGVCWKSCTCAANIIKSCGLIGRPCYSFCKQAGLWFSTCETINRMLKSNR